MKNVRFVGLGVDAETITVAVTESSGEVRSLGVIPNRTESVSRLMRKLGRAEQVRVCYEAGPTGYPLYWQLSKLGIKCEVVAPTLVPTKSGDRVKTDRRDAERLARCYRAGDLAPGVGARCRSRSAAGLGAGARRFQSRSAARPASALEVPAAPRGRRAGAGVQAWTGKYWEWVKSAVHFEQPALTATFIDYVHEVEHAAARISA